MSTKELIINLIDDFNEYQLQLLFNYARFLKADECGLLDFDEPNLPKKTITQCK